ncbi:putative queuine tRNA-ribosyltransferase [Neospora caninum Liverpool]|uniref:Putative queuine tRNA-ribosyltransferase n=1 Tax=Neospora caninum (strain Liverpool) TaxID=572307 RepID=F0VNZ4_NEOCL|nr:putative queuine tRNA-ribosyltransferase [Neospora caninum Liverpool]CBZ55440.1 putative queuine tRNA-ribosyltransferase [Neospora caninum Liverpool]CEL70176.1 TPA: queuine tRNA-ribosyltransferase, putative [Neospora caninum Liverpool]|eukprot:XP_003885468.1 putative queuine tRNA-ribosyltransferase [Neospora caninum Liverpool]
MTLASASPSLPSCSASDCGLGAAVDLAEPPALSKAREALQAALRFSLLHVDGRARCSIVHLPHGDVRTPIFMPVGTYGTLKGLNSRLLHILHDETLHAERKAEERQCGSGTPARGDAGDAARAADPAQEASDQTRLRADLEGPESGATRMPVASCLSSAFPSSPLSGSSRSSYATHERLRTPPSGHSFPPVFSSHSFSPLASTPQKGEQEGLSGDFASEGVESRLGNGEEGDSTSLASPARRPPASFSPIILGNTFHLYRHLGLERMEAAGGLHDFMGWGGNLLTDSGGFQMVSLLKIIAVREEGVAFAASSLDTKREGKRQQRKRFAADTEREQETEEKAEKEEEGGEDTGGGLLLLTPEKSIHMQNAMGSDIIMQLDDVVSSTTPDPARVEDAMQRSLRWLDRCIAAHRRPRDQALFGIVQGGLDPRTREVSLREIQKRPLPGFAIGGLSGGEAKDDFWRMVELSTRPGKGLPANKPRYVMGVGYPLDIVVCVALGCDMFDCVYPCRTARFGTALVREQGGILRVKQKKYKLDLRSLDPTCGCYACRNYSRAFFHASFGKMPAVSQLLTVHNLFFMQTLCLDMQRAIAAGTFPAFVRSFLLQLFPPSSKPGAGQGRREESAEGGDREEGKAREERTDERTDASGPASVAAGDGRGATEGGVAGEHEKPEGKALEEKKNKRQRRLKAEAKRKERESSGAAQDTCAETHENGEPAANLSSACPPIWVRDALRTAGIVIDDLYTFSEDERKN